MIWNIKDQNGSTERIKKIKKLREKMNFIIEQEHFDNIFMYHNYLNSDCCLLFSRAKCKSLKIYNNINILK